MLFTRFRLKYLSFHHPYTFSIIKSTVVENEILNTNPFKNKSYQDINRLLSLNISSSNELTMCNLIVKALSERIQKQNLKSLRTSTKEDTIREQIINKCLSKILNQFAELQPQETLMLIKFFIQLHEIRGIRIRDENKSHFKSRLPQHIKVLLNKDKEGRHVETFKNILYALLRSKKKLAELKEIIQYLVAKDLKTNAQMLSFFKNFSYLSRMNGYGLPIESLIQKFILNKSNTLENASEWVKPITMQVIQLYRDNIKMVDDILIKKFMDGLKHLLERQKVAIDDQIEYFKQMMDWCVFYSPYLLKVEDLVEGVDFTYWMLKKLEAEVQKQSKIKFNSFFSLMLSSYRFEQFARLSSQFLGKSSSQLLEEVKKVYYRVFQNGLLSNMNSLDSTQIASILSNDLHLSLELEQKFIKELIKHLERNKEQELLIHRLRLFQYTAKSIIENNLPEYKRSLEVLLKYIQKRSKFLRDYEILRVCNVTRVLGLKLNTFQDYVKFSKNKIEFETIENVSRTILKGYSQDIIKQNSLLLIEKYEDNQPQSSAKISKCIWYVFKNAMLEEKISNRDPLFILWFQEKYQITAEIFKNSKNFQFIINIALKEVNSHAKNFYSSICFEVLIEIFNIWRLSNKDGDVDQYQKLFFQNLRILSEFENIKHIFSSNFRHSFWVKIIWAFYRIGSEMKKSNSYYKRIRQTKQIIPILKTLKASLRRENLNIKNSMIFSYIQILDIEQELKMKNHYEMIKIWFWTNYHRMNWEKNMEGSRNWPFDNFIKIIQKQEGNACLIEFLLGIRGQYSQEIANLLSKSKIPKQLYEGTLAEETVLDRTKMLNLLALPRVLGLLLRKNESTANLFIQKLIQIKELLLPYKLVEAANIVEDIKQLLSLETKTKFKKWVHESLQSFGNPNQNATLLQLYLKFNIIPQQYQSAIQNYVKGELQTNNYFLVQLLYVNGYTGIGKQIQELIRLVESNRVLVYMQEQFLNEYIALFNGLLGLCLHQKNEGLIDKCVSLFTKNRRDLGEILKKASQKQKQELFILVEVAKNRIESSDFAREALESISYQIKQDNSQIQQKTYQQIKNTNLNQLRRQNLQLEMESSTNFPRLGNSLILFDNQQPGYYQLVAEYLSTTHQIHNIRVLNMEQILRQKPV